MPKVTSRQWWMIGLGCTTIFVILFYVGGWVLDVPKGTITIETFLRILSRRSFLVVAMMTAAILVTAASLVFQTLTQNRILTPSLMGFDAVYVAAQTMFVFLLGTVHPFVTHEVVNFLFSTALMVFVSMVMYGSILRRHHRELSLMLLLGLVISSMLRSTTSFLATLMNPDEFQTVIASTSVSLTNIATPLVVVAVPLMGIFITLLVRQHLQFDVMTLGRSQAIGLGLPYDRIVKRNILFISVAMAIATALVGPLGFLGLIAVNASRELNKTHRHRTLFFLSSMVAMVLLIGGQLLVEWLGFMTTVTVLINLVGGVYVVLLIIKENRS